MITPANEAYLYAALAAVLIIYFGYVVILRARERSLIRRARAVDSAASASVAPSASGASSATATGSSATAESGAGSYMPHDNTVQGERTNDGGGR